MHFLIVPPTLADPSTMDIVFGYSSSATMTLEPEPSAPSNRRRGSRQPCHAPAWLSPEAQVKNSRQQQVYVTDLSTYGVGFTGSKFLDTGAIHWIVLGIGAMRASSRIRIASCRPNDQGSYEIGAEFF